MPQAIHVPRINNNDDQVKLVELHVAVGDTVADGQVVAAVETDKANVEVQASAAGFVIAVRGELGSSVEVGSVLIWIGAAADEAPPAEARGPASAASFTDGAPTAKALALLQQYGLTGGQVMASGARLSAEDVRRHVADKNLRPVTAAAAAPAAVAGSAPEMPGTRRTLAPHERGMLQTVTWQRENAAPGYIEMAYDHAAWDAHASAYGKQHGLLLNPLLPLMCWRLVELVAAQPRYNATLVDGDRLEYERVNLGFATQAGEVLYLAVLHDAAAATPLGFVQQLIELQRRAAAHRLEPQELSGATVGFSSMSRWSVARHVPILAPHTALMLAHTVDAKGEGTLGATYDHRVLHGGDVAILLRKLTTLPKPRDKS
jgi:pyruvate dehydrogenase E2 component (dihydrolipoamide acetyltransferase)